MDIRKVKKLIELLEESGIGEIEIKEGEESVRISRGVSGAPAPVQAYAAAPPPAPAQAAVAPAAPAAAPAAEPEAAASATNGHVVKSKRCSLRTASPWNSINPCSPSSNAPG